MDTATEHAPQHAGALVVFGITGNLAKLMTFLALYRLEELGQLDCPVVGVAVDDWSNDDLRTHARAAIAAHGEVDASVFDRLMARFAYVRGDFADAATYGRVGDAIAGAAGPVVFYLEIPPSLFARVVAGLAGAGLTRDARIVLEKPFGHDLASAQALSAELHRHVDESQLYRIDHFLAKLGLEEILYLRFMNSMLAAVWDRNSIESVQISMAESFGVEDRGSFYDPVGALRDVVVNHLMRVLAAVAMEAPARGDRRTIKDAQVTVFRATASADPAQYVRGQYEGYQQTPGVAADSRTETYAALRLDIGNQRWSGVPFFIRAGKHLPVTQTEVRIVFKRPLPLGFARAKESEMQQGALVIRLDPSTGMRLILNARRADAVVPRPVALDAEFTRAGGPAPSPYAVLLHAALVGDITRFTHQDGVEETWRIMQPLLDAPPPALPYPQGTWGPAGADDLLAGFTGWADPWMGA